MLFMSTVRDIYVYILLYAYTFQNKTYLANEIIS